MAGTECDRSWRDAVYDTRVRSDAGVRDIGDQQNTREISKKERKKERKKHAREYVKKTKQQQLRGFR